MNKNVMRFT